MVCIPKETNIGHLEDITGILSSKEKCWVVPQAAKHVLIAQLRSGAEESSDLMCDTMIKLPWQPFAVYFIKVVIKIEMGRGDFICWSHRC